MNMSAGLDERLTKRRRIEADAHSGGDVSSLLAVVNEHCLLVILGFLSTVDLDTFAICGRRCRAARNNPQLDQTRTGIIIWGHQHPWTLRLYDAIVVNGWNQVFSGNRRRLVVVGLERVEPYTNMAEVKRRARQADVKLTGVISLDLSYAPGMRPGNRTVMATPMKALAHILPNLQELDISYVKTTSSVVAVFAKLCPNLRRVTWNGCDSELFLNGQTFRQANLTELYVDNSQLYACDWDESVWTEEGSGVYLWIHCKHLERLSMTNATWWLYSRREPTPVTQEMLIKFVRHAPVSLRWFRSNLTAENIKMLQRERPGITLVTGT